MSFEEAMKKLDEISILLEDEKTSVDESIKLYAQCEEIIKNAYEIISSAKGKVKEITENLQEVDFNDVKKI